MDMVVKSSVMHSSVSNLSLHWTFLLSHTIILCTQMHTNSSSKLNKSKVNVSWHSYQQSHPVHIINYRELRKWDESRSTTAHYATESTTYQQLIPQVIRLFHYFKNKQRPEIRPETHSSETEMGQIWWALCLRQDQDVSTRWSRVRDIETETIPLWISECKVKM